MPRSLGLFAFQHNSLNVPNTVRCVLGLPSRGPSPSLTVGYLAPTITLGVGHQLRVLGPGCSLVPGHPHPQVSAGQPRPSAEPPCFSPLLGGDGAEFPRHGASGTPTHPYGLGQGQIFYPRVLDLHTCRHTRMHTHHKGGTLLPHTQNMQHTCKIHRDQDRYMVIPVSKVPIQHAHRIDLPIQNIYTDLHAPCT